VPAAELRRAAAADLRALLAQRRVGERLKRLVQRRELVRNPQEAFCGVHAAVERMHLVAEAVEALEHGIELSVVEVLTFSHES
jgi:hypothetical protein